MPEHTDRPPARDRRGRGQRGPAVLPGPLTPAGVPRSRTAGQRFDALVLEVVTGLTERWGAELGAVEFAVEDAPVLGQSWSVDTVPLASLVRAGGDRPTRIVVFRRPLELRAETPAELGALVLAVIVEQVSEFLGRSPDEVDPRYGGHQ